MKNPKPGESAASDAQARAVEWAGILKAGVQAQRLVPGAVCVGGTAAALYAGHRVSLDTDHLLPALRDHFEDVRARLDEVELPHYKGLTEKWHRWETTRTICQRFGVMLGEALVRGGN